MENENWSQRLSKIKEEFARNKSVAGAISTLEILAKLPFDAAGIDNSEYWPDICLLVEVLLKAVPLDVMMKEHQIVMLALINNAPEKVILSVVNEYFKPNVGSNKELFRTSALAVIVALSRRLSGAICYESVASFLCDFMDVKEIRLELEDQLKDQRNSEKRFRVYEVLRATFARDNFSNYGLIRPILDKLINEMDEDDLLSCIAALDVLSEIAAVRKENAEYFNSIGLLDQTYSMFTRSKDNPDGGLIHCACIRFFGYLSVSTQDSLERFPLFTHEIFDMIYHFDQVDVARRQLAFDTLSVMTGNSGAKKYLSQTLCAYNIRKAMNHFGVAIGIAPDEMRIRHIESLKMMMTSLQDPADSLILLEWFKDLGEPFPTMIYNFLKKPFEDLQIACFEFIISLVKSHNWTFLQFSRVSGFMDYLLDRRSNCSPQICKLKYDLACSVLDNEQIGIDETTLGKLRKYQEEGLYAAPQAGFAMEWANN